MQDLFLEIGGLNIELLLHFGVLLVEELFGLLDNDELAHVLTVLLDEVLERVGAHLSHEISTKIRFIIIFSNYIT